jgi:hypothetical protein
LATRFCYLADWCNGFAHFDFDTGATALIVGGSVRFSRPHMDPMDLGQPIEEVACALSIPVTPEMHLDYHGAISELGQKHHPIVWTINKWLPIICVVVAVWFFLF